jgi:hypothetical protein
MGLTEEPVKRKKQIRVPVASYIPDDDQEWLQENRIELNAMTTEQFIDWLTARVSAYFRGKRLSPKVVPPAQVVGERLNQETRAALERSIVDEVLKAADIPGQVEASFAKVERRVKAMATALVRGLPGRLNSTPVAHWTDIVKAEAAAVAFPDGEEKPVRITESEA